MGTRATIRFKEGDEEYFVYRGHDGFPENVMEDIQRVIDKAKGRWSEPELGLLVTSFLQWTYEPGIRIPRYEITQSFHGDESYKYFVEWEQERKEWKVIVI